MNTRVLSKVETGMTDSFRTGRISSAGEHKGFKQSRNGVVLPCFFNTCYALCNFSISCHPYTTLAIRGENLRNVRYNKREYRENIPEGKY